MPRPPDTITVWTVHPTGFDLSQPDLKYDHASGGYWNDNSVGSRYREVLMILLRHFRVNGILWCWNTPFGWWSFTDECVWGITIPASAVLDCFDTYRWGAVIQESAGTRFFPELMSLGKPPPATPRCEVLMGWPLPHGCTPINCGSPTRGKTIDNADFARFRAAMKR